MLASLLPGLRQLRAPIAAGFVWLVTAWLALADFVPHSPETASGVFRAVFDIAGVAGEAGISAAAGFIAYLLGILSVQVSTALAAMPMRIRGRRSWHGAVRQAISPPSRSGRHALAETVVRELVQRSSSDDDLLKMLEKTRVALGARPGPDVLASLVRVRLDIESYVDNIVADLPLIPLRLIDDSERKELFGEFDRRRAESEFRAAVALPLVALTAVLVVRVSPWFTFGLVVSGVLAVQAHLAAVSAADVLAESIRAQQPAPPSPALDGVRAGPLIEREDWLFYAAGERYRPAAGIERSQGADAAERYYRVQAGTGDPSAMMWLAGRLHKSEKPGEDGWYSKAADAGDADALTIRALDGMREISRRELDAVKSAYARDRTAMKVAADVLTRLEARDSGGSSQNHLRQHQQAKEWYEEAWKAGDVAAGEALAQIHEAAGSPRRGAVYRRPFRGATPEIEANGSASDLGASPTVERGR